MTRDNARTAPDCPVPGGYRIRPYTPGDETHWRRIHHAADSLNTIDSTLFYRAFGCNLTHLRQRQLYAHNSTGFVVATITGWHDAEPFNTHRGRVHWLAVLPQEQGKGIAKSLLSAVCRRLYKIGNEELYLTTASSRTQAINLYLQFGFKPMISTDADRAQWNALQDRLRYPVTA